jgi:energy-coupling factor transporter ATP-binding protein EcfA2
MWISRIRVTGGFLNGLDISLSEGLNVVIGPRGSGKTTLLELLRHAVGAEHAEQHRQLERQQFLDAVLGTGEVVLDVETDQGGRHLVVDAEGGGQRGDLSRSVLVLGQNELEEIASDEPSRLNLLDLRTGATTEMPDGGEAATLTAEIFDLRERIVDRREESRKRERLLADRQLLISQETALMSGDAKELVDQRELLRQTEERVIQTGRELALLAEVRHEIHETSASQDLQARRLSVAAGRANELRDAAEVKDALAEVVQLSQRMGEVLLQAQNGVETAATTTTEANIAARESAAPIRETLERAEAGLGQVTAQLRNVEAELRSIDSNDARLVELESTHADLLLKRADYLDRIEKAEELLYQIRSEIARSVTAQITTNVIVVVHHLADSGAFREFLHESLRGTRTRASIIDAVAETILPRQLLDIVEMRRADALAAIANISHDNAQKIIENLDKSDILQQLAMLRLKDRVDFRLRDGSVDKSIDELSTGQKCAVVLPIVLSEQLRTLILDQPEDHLDNAFLVTNVIGGLDSRRQSGAQTIIATHNANIPVLGEAENVIVLTSDGQAGTVAIQGPFDTDTIVDNITRLMEGGREAFARRSAFYAQHSTEPHD